MRAASLTGACEAVLAVMITPAAPFPSVQRMTAATGSPSSQTSMP